MRYETNSKEELEELNAEKWQLDLLQLNPSYCSWGPHEDYMATDKGWDSRCIIEDWKSFGWKLDDLNELVNFYFSVERKSEECKDCDGTGYSPDAKILADTWYDFERTGKRWCSKIEQPEVDALWEAGRLNLDFKEKPTPSEVNKWNESKGLGHDAINRSICIEARAKTLGIDLYCEKCGGNGYVYTAPKAHVSLVLWMTHPRKGCSRGIEVTKIEQSDLPEIKKYLLEARSRFLEKFDKIKNL